LTTRSRLERATMRRLPRPRRLPGPDGMEDGSVGRRS
jgi:hypothetical protein